MSPVSPDTVVSAEIARAIEAEWSSGAVSSTAPDNCNVEGPHEESGPRRWKCPNPRYAVVRCNCCARTWERQVECGDRACGPCRYERALRFGERWREALSRWPGGYFLTLTFPNLKTYPIRGDLDDLRKRWKAFLRRNSWIVGGWYSIECTFHKETGFNLHLHALVRAHYSRPMEQVLRTWREVCPEARWVHVSQVRSVRHAMLYLVGEIAKGSDVALPGRCHLVQRFGDVGGAVAEIVARCPYCGAVGQIGVEIDVWEWGRMLEV